MNNIRNTAITAVLLYADNMSETFGIYLWVHEYDYGIEFYVYMKTS